MNKFAIAIIKRFEGCRLQAYPDVGGVWTIGYGYTGPEVVKGLVISQLDADSLLTKDLYEFESGVNNLVKVTLSQQKLAALISFAYNLGLGALTSSSLLKAVNASQFDVAADKFLKWDHVNGKVIKGLTARRAAERALFLSVDN